jgi:hypothetical protein
MVALGMQKPAAAVGAADWLVDMEATRLPPLAVKPRTEEVYAGCVVLAPFDAVFLVVVLRVLVAASRVGAAS